MADDNKKVLDLDEMFGDSRPIKVKWNDQEYLLLRLEAFSPREINGFQKMHKDAVTLQGQGSEASDERIVELFDKMLSFLCPSLPLDKVPFLAKTRIITFYIEETMEKKALEVTLSLMQTGATPSVA